MYTNPNCHDFVIEGNVFHDIGRTNAGQLDHGLYLRGANFTIVNNIFYNIQHGWAIQAAQGLSSVLIANNTFAFPGTNKGSHIMLWRMQTDITIRNNIFYTPAAPARDNYAITQWTSLVSGCSIDHNVVFGSRDVILQSSGCATSGNLQGSDPQFISPSSAPYDFHLQPTSPAIHAGVPIPGLRSDFDGSHRPHDSPNDAGAYQYFQSHFDEWAQQHELGVWLGFSGARPLTFIRLLYDSLKPFRHLFRILRRVLLGFLRWFVGACPSPGAAEAEHGFWCKHLALFQRAQDESRPAPTTHVKIIEHANAR
jgi:hypothetical protein